VEDLLAQCHAEHLTAIRRQADTYIVQKGTGKGPGFTGGQEIPEVHGRTRRGDRRLGRGTWRARDGRRQLCGLQLFKRVRELARRANCRVMGEPFQRGLTGGGLGRAWQ